MLESDNASEPNITNYFTYRVLADSETILKLCLTLFRGTNIGNCFR